MQKCHELGQLSGNSGLIEKRYENGYKIRAKYKIKLVQKMEAVLPDGGGRKIKDMDLEEMLLEWITLQRSKNLQVSRKRVHRKARIYAEEKAASKG